MDDLDLREIDQLQLEDRIQVLELSGDISEEHRALCWARAMLWLLGEGFIEIDPDGRVYPTPNCPECLPEALHG